MALNSWKVLAEVHTVEPCRNVRTEYLAKKITIRKPYAKRFGHNSVLDEFNCSLSSLKQKLTLDLFDQVSVQKYHTRAIRCKFRVTVTFLTESSP